MGQPQQRWLVLFGHKRRQNKQAQEHVDDESGIYPQSSFSKESSQVAVVIKALRDQISTDQEKPVNGKLTERRSAKVGFQRHHPGQDRRRMREYDRRGEEQAKRREVIQPGGGARAVECRIITHY